jgi:signal transduction histidine kinase
MRALRVAEHATLLVLGLVAGLGLDGGLRPWTPPLVLVLIAGAIVVGRYRPLPPTRPSWLWAALPGVVVLGGVLAIDLWEAVSAVVLAALGVGLPFAVARARRQQTELLAAERARTAALLAERAAVDERARVAERSRLAADIHHTLGHELALIGVRAGALEVTCDDPTQQDAAAAVRASAAAATDHLRRALDLLEPATPADGVDDVVNRARASGLAVDLDGDGHHDLPEPLARLVEHTVREGIANAARHAAGAAVRVTYRPDATEVVLRITNGRGDPGEPGTGRGLRHLAEQSRALGAALHAGPDDQGWTLELRAPR